METGGGGRCAAKRLDLMSLNCTFKMVKKVKSILGVFHHTHTHAHKLETRYVCFFCRKQIQEEPVGTIVYLWGGTRPVHGVDSLLCELH